MTTPSRAWMIFAVCRGMDAEVFYVDRGGHIGAAAKAICASCPVQKACLDYANANHETHGVWGGMGPKDRRNARRRARRAAA